MADVAPMDIQSSEGDPQHVEAVEDVPPVVVHLPSEDIIKESAPPPPDLIEPLEPIQDEKAMDPHPPSVQPCLGDQSSLEPASGPSILTSAHDQREHATGIQQESLVESTSAAEVAKLEDYKHEATMTDASVELKSDSLNEASIIPDAKDLQCVKTQGGDIRLDGCTRSPTQTNDDEAWQEHKQGLSKMDSSTQPETEPNLVAGHEAAMTTPNKSFLQELPAAEGYESGTEEEQAAFRKNVESFYRENGLEFKAPKFYKEELNLLKLWRAVIKLGGYERVTSCKLWRQVGESFRPPKTCTTISWTFRIFYEKALLEYEKNKLQSGELPLSDGPFPQSQRVESEAGGNQTPGSGRARRDAATRAMQGWHTQHLFDNGEDDKFCSAAKVDNKQFKTNGAGLLKRRKPSGDEHAVNITPIKMMKSNSMVTDVGPPAEWVKINIQKTSECFEIYALVPGLLREEVHVQSDPAGRVIISGQPEQLDNPWGITPFKKVVSLPCRIDPHQTSAVVTLHGQLFVRAPFEQQGQ